MNKVNEGMNQFCAPAVLSILTGKSTDECASVIASINGHREVREVAVKDIITATKKLRFNVEEIASDCSLFSLMHQIHSQDSMYLVVVRKHVVALEVLDSHIMLCDNHTKEPIDGAASARLGQRVVAAFKVTAKESAILVAEELIWKEHSYSNNQIFVDLKKEYRFKDPEDNYGRHIGYITVNSREELKAIRDLMLTKV